LRFCGEVNRHGKIEKVPADLIGACCFLIDLYRISGAAGLAMKARFGSYTGNETSRSIVVMIQYLQDLIDGEFSSILASPLRFLCSLDHSIRSRQHVRRNRKSDLFGSLEIDRQFKFRRLLDGKIGGLSAFEDFVHVIRRLSVHTEQVGAITHETTFFHISSPRINGGKANLNSKRDDTLAISFQLVSPKVE
jgi:hypothetical protein